MSLTDHLDAIFAADRTLRREEAALLKQDDRSLSELLATAVEQAAALEDDRESGMRLERLADLCAQVPGPDAVDTLIQILDMEEATVRVQAADALVDVAFERYAEVARAVERALDGGRRGPAMQELPWVITEIGEPSARGLIRRFLDFEDADIVASAVEALATLGDPEAVADLEPLLGDRRPVALDDYEGEVSETLGQLVSEAIDALQP